MKIFVFIESELGGLATFNRQFKNFLKYKFFENAFQLSIIPTQSETSIEFHSCGANLYIKDYWELNLDVSIDSAFLPDAIIAELDSIMSSNSISEIFFVNQYFGFNLFLEHSHLPKKYFLHLPMRNMFQVAHDDVNNMDLYEFLDKEKAILRIEKNAIEASNELIVICKGLVLDFHQLYPEFKNKKITYIRYGAEPKIETNKVSDQSTLLYFGRLTAYKGLHHFLKNFSEIDKKLIGKGQFPFSSRKFSNYSTEPWQSQAEMLNVVKNYEYCVFPSTFEPFGLALNEALRLKKVCLVQKGTSGHEEQIVDGQNGFLVDFQTTNFQEVSYLLKHSDLSKIKRQADKNLANEAAFFGDLSKIV